MLLCFKTLSVNREPVQVGRETEVDCALAELYVRSLATERLVKDTAHSEIFNSIFTRMNEAGLCTSKKRSPSYTLLQGLSCAIFAPHELLTYSVIQQNRCRLDWAGPLGKL